jgi:hypothetical protein
MQFNGVMLFEEEPERECWHEAGHAVMAKHLGMTVMAIGFSWPNGPNGEAYPSTWIPTDGFDKDSVAKQLMSGSAGEILGIGDFDIMARNSDLQAFKSLGCPFSHDHYINWAVEILKTKHGALAGVYERLMKERTNPSHEPFIDADGIKKQKHLTQEEFESLV